MCLKIILLISSSGERISSAYTENFWAHGNLLRAQSVTVFRCLKLEECFLERDQVLMILEGKLIVNRWL